MRTIVSMSRVLSLLSAIAVAATLLAAPAVAAPAPQAELNPPLTSGGGVNEIPLLTPDGAHVVYTARRSSGDPLELYVSPTDGSAPPKRLSTGPVMGEPVLTPDGTRVVYLARELQPTITELYTTKLDGTEHFRVNSPLGAGRQVRNDFALSADSNGIAYVADRDTDDRFELWFTIIGAGGPAPGVKLNNPLVADGDITAGSVSFSPDGNHIVWRADQSADGRIELFSAEVGAFSEKRLNPALGGNKLVASHRITPDSSRVLYVSDQQNAGEFELYSATIDGGLLTPRVSDNLTGNSDVQSNFQITPDGAWVIFKADREVDGIDRVFAGYPDGSLPPTPLTPPPVAGRIIFGNPVISPDGVRVAYLADHTVDDVIDLYTVRVDGSTDPVRISPSISGVFSPTFSPDSQSVLYTARHDDPERMEVYARAADASGPIRKLNPELPADRESTDEVIPLADGEHVLYQVGFPGGAPDDDLYLARIDGPPVAVQLDDGHPVDRNVRELAIAGPVVAFTADRDVADQYQLFTARVEDAIERLDAMDDAARFVALPPGRLFDTRDDHPGNGPKGFVGAGQTIDVQITGVAGVPPDAVAVVMNVTATESAAEGFVTAFPFGQPLPLASNLNLTRPDQTRPNLVTVPLGPGGKVSLHTQSGTHLLGDVAGYYLDADIARADGRLVPLTPDRVFDTRPGQPAPGHKGFVGADQTLDVQITGVGGVPNTGVAAVVINLTATEAAAEGFVTAWPKGQPRPLASNLNLNGPGDTAPNLAIIPIGDGGMISLYTQSGTHLLGDVTGYITDPTAVVDDAGLFVPLPPGRVFDTRNGQPAGPTGYVGAGATIRPSFVGLAGIPAYAGAVALNLTATEAATGFVTAWPDGLPRPLASNLNLNGPLDTRPNAAILPLGANGRIAHYADAGAHLLADTTGYYLD